MDRHCHARNAPCEPGTRFGADGLDHGCCEVYAHVRGLIRREDHRLGALDASFTDFPVVHEHRSRAALAHTSTGVGWDVMYLVM